MKTIFGTHDQTSYISNRQRRQHMGGKDITKNCLLCQTYRMGPDIFHFLKVVINVLCLSSVALPCAQYKCTSLKLDWVHWFGWFRGFLANPPSGGSTFGLANFRGVLFIGGSCRGAFRSDHFTPKIPKSYQMQFPVDSARKMREKCAKNGGFSRGLSGDFITF